MSTIPLKVIVLDDTQSESDGSHDIHVHGFDARRWNWLKGGLAAGQAANQLMIIAVHAPIAVESIGFEVEWCNDRSAAAHGRRPIQKSGQSVLGERLYRYRVSMHTEGAYRISKGSGACQA
jgi:hypothetical protein